MFLCDVVRSTWDCVSWICSLAEGLGKVLATIFILRYFVLLFVAIV